MLFEYIFWATEFVKVINKLEIQLGHYRHSSKTSVMSGCSIYKIFRASTLPIRKNKSFIIAIKRNMSEKGESRKNKKCHWQGIRFVVQWHYNGSCKNWQKPDLILAAATEVTQEHKKWNTKRVGVFQGNPGVRVRGWDWQQLLLMLSLPTYVLAKCCHKFEGTATTTRTSMWTTVDETKTETETEAAAKAEPWSADKVQRNNMQCQTAAGREQQRKWVRLSGRTTTTTTTATRTSSRTRTRTRTRRQQDNDQVASSMAACWKLANDLAEIRAALEQH